MIASDSFARLNERLDNMTNGHAMEASLFATGIFLALALLPMVIAIVRGRKDLGPELFLAGLIGFFASGSLFTFPVGWYLYYRNYQTALTA